MASAYDAGNATPSMLAGSLRDDAVNNDHIPPGKVRVREELAGQPNEVNEGEYSRMVVKRGVLQVGHQK